MHGPMNIKFPVLWNQEGQYHVNQSQSTVPIPSQLTPVHIPTDYSPISTKVYKVVSLSL